MNSIMPLSIIIKKTCDSVYRTATIMTLGITTLSIMTFSITIENVTAIIMIQHNNGQLDTQNKRQPTL
jgi:hypothetical protein